VRGEKSLRAKLAEELAKRSDSLILASATPHDGRPASFASLMNMLNPTAITDPDHYGPQDISGLFLRRFKKDVREQMKAAVHDRQTFRFAAPATDAEDHAFLRLTELRFASLDKGRRTGQLLFRTVIEKSLFSSPAACLQTIRQRLKKLEVADTAEASTDIESLRILESAVDAITPARFSKYQRLLALLRPGGQLDWDPSDPRDRLVIFTERVETLKFLRDHLKDDLDLKANQIATLNGQDNDDKEIQATVEKFGQAREPVRLLIATDIASEGINLHHLSSKLIHFDIPWSMPRWPRSLPPTKPASKSSTPLATGSWTWPSRKTPPLGFDYNRNAPKAARSTPSSPTIAITSARLFRPKTLRFSA
jgi:SNF2 family DNA or RNA helicase